MDKKTWVSALLAVVALLGLLAIIALLATRPIPTENKDLFNVALMAVVSCVGTAFGYFLGSSAGSATKNDIISKMTAPPPEAPPGG